MALRYSLLFSFVLLALPASAQVAINEVLVSTTSTDTEFFELAGDAGTSLDGLTLVVVEGDSDSSTGLGIVDRAIALSGTIPADGYWLAASPAAKDAGAFDLPDAEVDLDIADNTFENGTETFLLVRGFTGAVGDDLDANDDGTADYAEDGATVTAPWTELLDALALLDADAGDATYATPVIGPNGTFLPAGVYRSPNRTGDFLQLEFSPIPAPSATPGAANPSSAPEDYVALLLGANEVEPVETAAAGSVQLRLTGTELVVTGRFDDLESDFATDIGAHLHGGAVGENGSVRYALSPTLDADNRGGTFEADNNTFTVRETFADSLRNGLVYVNVHSVDNMGGEVRGQLLETVPTTALSLRQVRIVGPGFSVSTTGTVSRAMGDIAFIQSEEGGLQIRQFSGAFRDAVMAGTIAPGTVLEVTGELSESNGTLEINGSDLASYTTAAGTEPEPIRVSLAQLLADGEFYEGRLVYVQNVTFNESGTFSEFTTYTISDGTDSFAVRLNDEEESAIVGTAIPSGPATVEGVIAEFRGDYQFLPIRASDVLVFNVGVGDGPDGALALSVANPLRGATTVRFETGAPGPAMVSVFDVLGRQVALLADGETDGAAQTAAFAADALASGTYVVRLQAGDRVLTRTVTVIR